jgi:hypothetical protein
MRSWRWPTRNLSEECLACFGNKSVLVGRKLGQPVVRHTLIPLRKIRHKTRPGVGKR